MPEMPGLLLSLLLSTSFPLILACESGDSCSFYGCLESFIPCEEEGYAVAYGGKYCQIFKDMSPTMSPLGQDWTREIRKCL